LNQSEVAELLDFGFGSGFLVLLLSVLLLPFEPEPSLLAAVDELPRESVA